MFIFYDKWTKDATVISFRKKRKTGEVKASATQRSEGATNRAIFFLQDIFYLFFRHCSLYINVILYYDGLSLT